MKFKLDFDEDAEVDFSPLVDCVFLLIIFFLVAMMLKKWEMQIPVRMPDITSNLAENQEEDIFLLGLDAKGGLYGATGEMISGYPLFVPVDDMAAFLRGLPPGQQLRILSEHKAPFQKAIDLLDTCQHEGFDRTEIKLIAGRIRVVKTTAPNR